MRIEFIKANNFKSLVNFELLLAPFTCLIGLNGSGKSTVLQFVDFLAQLARGDLRGWLAERNWRRGELNSGLLTEKRITFTVILDGDPLPGRITWTAWFNPNLLRCTTESIQTPRAALRVHEGVYRILTREYPDAELETRHSGDIAFSYEGSILSQLRPSLLPSPLLEFKNYLTAIQSPILLSPQYLRSRARESGGTLGLGGEKLSAYLSEMSPSRRHRLTEALKEVYKHLEQIETSSLRAGWKKLEIVESFNGKKLRTEARHVNDGLLRLAAILAELQSDRPLLLFDEIENGINPELVEFLVTRMLSAEQQVLVTTHSPLILNYLTDEQASASVVYLYKKQTGETGAVRFFSIPSLAEKLTVMGPGEAFADTNLVQLADEIQQMADVR